MDTDPKVSLEYFGQFISQELRDTAMAYFDVLINQQSAAPSLSKLQSELSSLSEEQKQVVRRGVLHAVDGGIHDFLFKLQEQADFDNRIKIFVDGNNVVEASDGIHGEQFTSEGWFAKYSKDGKPPEEG